MMKTYVDLPPKVGKKAIVFFLMSFLCVAIFLFIRFLNNSHELDLLIKEDVNGKIVKLENRGRGAYDMVIKTQNGTFKINSLPIGYEVKNSHIQEGDYIRKSQNSDAIFFYNYHNNSLYTKCTYSIR